MNLSRDEILGKDDLPREAVPIPEWAGTVFVRCMTGAERDRFEDAHLQDPHRDFRARLAAATVCDAAGSLLFTVADIPALTAKSAAALDRIFPVAARLSGISKQDVEDLTKNS